MRVVLKSCCQVYTDSKREAIVGTTKQHFDTREEAEAAIIESRERSRVLLISCHCKNLSGE